MLLNVRKAVFDDIEKINDLWKQLSVDQLSKDSYFEGDLNFKGDPNLSNMEYVFNNPFVAFFVAETKEKVIGYIEVLIHKKDFYFFVDDYAYILHLFVEPQYRKAVKAAYGLYNAAESWAVSKGCRFIEADVFSHNTKVETLLRYEKFNEYRTRFVKRLDD